MGVVTDFGLWVFWFMGVVTDFVLQTLVYGYCNRLWFMGIVTDFGLWVL